MPENLGRCLQLHGWGLENCKELVGLASDKDSISAAFEVNSSKNLCLAVADCCRGRLNTGRRCSRTPRSASRDSARSSSNRVQRRRWMRWQKCVGCDGKRPACCSQQDGVLQFRRAAVRDGRVRMLHAKGEKKAQCMAAFTFAGQGPDVQTQGAENACPSNRPDAVTVAYVESRPQVARHR